MRSSPTHPVNPFDTLGHTNVHGSAYWSARDLMPVLGYSSWRRFADAIHRAQTTCRNLGEDVKDHFVAGFRPLTSGAGSHRKVTDYALSRFACYLIAMNGDPRKPEIASAQAYFAVQTQRMELLEGELANLEQRADACLRITESVKQVNAAAAAAGVNSRSFGIFHDAGYKGLYGGLGLREIKDHKGVGQKEDLLDRMGRAELAANEFRITQTEQKLKNEHIHGQQQAIATHHAVGKEIRETIERLGGTPPEDLPPESSIRPLVEQRTREQRKLPPGTTQSGLFSISSE